MTAYKKVFRMLAAALVPLMATSPVHANDSAVFSELDYEAVDTFNTSASSAAHPILPGSYPDPSIVKVGKDYYLVTSTFAYFPGLPIFHSTDLINWTQIGNAFSDPKTMNLKGRQASRGLYAPDISHHNGVFYIINTCRECGGNFIITATDPAGPWSAPIWFAFEGIDPSLYFEGDRAYIVSNGIPPYPKLYQSHRSLYLQELDLSTMKVVGERKVLIDGGTNIAAQTATIEGPRLYKRNGYYYLLAAEGGTRFNHSQVVFRSRDIWGPYVGFEGNPILTQRDVAAPRSNPVTSTGHASLVEGPDGGWWAVFLGTRPYRGDFYNTGRETFLLKADWSGEWPIILPKQTAVPAHYGDANYAARVRKVPRASPFGPEGRLGWMGLRIPDTDFHRWTGERSLTLEPSDAMVGDINRTPSFWALRQTAKAVRFKTRIQFNLSEDGDAAGILAMQSDNFYVFCGPQKAGDENRIILSMRDGKAMPEKEIVVAQSAYDGKAARLELSVDETSITCRANGTVMSGQVPTETLSSARSTSSGATSYVGTMIGVYAHRSSRQAAGKPGIGQQ